MRSGIWFPRKATLALSSGVKAGVPREDFLLALELTKCDKYAGARENHAINAPFKKWFILAVDVFIFS